MKKLLSIFVVLAMILSMATMVSAKTADINNQSVEGTATIDGVKDDAYNNGLILSIDQKGTSNGGGDQLESPIGTAYILNDAEYVYWFVEVIDSTLDNTSGNAYERDSVEIFYMDDNSKVQLRFCYDGDVGADTGKTPAAEDWTIVTTDTGYNFEFRMPITDVRNNEIETCVQINYCENGSRTHTTYITGNAEGDNAWQRSNRQNDNDCWWTLTLAGEHEDTRVDPEEKPDELKKNNWETYQNVPTFIQLFAQDQVSWGWIGVGSGVSGVFNVTTELNWTDLKMSMNFDETTTSNYTVDPKFNIQLANSEFLALPEDAEVGDTGDSGKFNYTYTDIVITADGYDDVVIPAGEIGGTLQVKKESWGRGGDALEITLVPSIKEQLGLDTAALCEYLKNVTSVSTNITLVSYNLVTQEVIDEFLVALDAEYEELLVELQEYFDKVTAAEELLADESADITAKEEAVSEADKAVKRINTKTDGYPKAPEMVAELQARVDALNATLETLKTPVEETPDLNEEPTNDEVVDEPATTPATDSEGTNVGLIIAIVAIVVVVVVVVIVVVSKKKK